MEHTTGLMEWISGITAVDDQSLILIVISMVLTLLLSSLLVWTYEQVSREVIQPDHFLQSMILMAIVTTTIMQSIGDSMARGFGIFGALAILRFRTLIISPRNIAFIFGSMAVGIACGVYSFLTAIVGTLSFCLAAFLLYLTPFSRKNNLKGSLRVSVPLDADPRSALEALLKQHCRKFVLKRYRIDEAAEKTGQVEYLYEFKLLNELAGSELSHAVRALPGTASLRLSVEDTYINLYD